MIQKTTELLLELEKVLRERDHLKEVIRQVVKKSPFIATSTGVQVELSFDTIKLLQDALKDA